MKTNGRHSTCVDLSWVAKRWNTCVDWTSKLISTKVSGSCCKSTQVHAGARKAWPNGVEGSPSFVLVSTCKSALPEVYSIKTYLFMIFMIWSSSSPFTRNMSHSITFPVSHLYSRTAGTLLLILQHLCSSWDVTEPRHLLLDRRIHFEHSKFYIQIFNTSSVVTDCCIQVRKFPYRLEILSIHFDLVLRVFALILNTVLCLSWSHSFSLLV